eukprot:CAMPEP_0204897642 /NCGR_PEP_ID=MMETSP1397-20131031/854_1 /ASSEMBLY_ACC=CAM_ASM_000891 /TAXON_ID=49980 /ORGANISM="Climacostomum Climacostomum virens, Strain Stock W-24" /LENGTH=860 /DNA_ID=CAMNT_0052065419 /DNA_START=630 /DNA_END=3215 /DNA_ORIENTATION=-
MAVSALKSLFGGKKKDTLPKAPPFNQSAEAEELRLLTFAALSHTGAPSGLTGAISYDRVQEVLALGTIHGHIKLLSRNGKEELLADSSRMPVEHLLFITNTGMLLSATQDQVLSWNIVERSAMPLVRLNAPVTKLYLSEYSPSPTALSYVYIGLANGDLRVFNLREMRLTAYCLKFEAVWGTPEAAGIVDLEMHPKEETQILIAYTKPGLALWDLKNTKCLKKFEATEQLQCAAWHPAGSEVIAGTSEGSIVFWRMKDKVSRPYKLQQVKDPHEDVNAAPVQKVIWLEQHIVILGGQPFSDPCNVLLFTGENLTVKIPFVKCQAQPILAIVEAPLNEGMGGVRENLYILSDKGSLYSYDFPQEPRPQATLATVPGTLGPGNIIASELISVATEGEAVLEFTSLLAGAEVDVSQTALLITAHEDGLVHFWSLQNLKMTFIGSIAMCRVPYKLGQNILLQLNMDECKISLVKLSVIVKTLVIGYNLGFIGIFKVSPDGVSLSHVQQLNESPVLRAVMAGPTLVLGDFDCNLLAYDLLREEIVLRADLKIPPPADKQKPYNQDLIVNEVLYIPSASRLIAGLSNGTLRAFDALSWDYLPSPESPLKDTKSQTPKRSEVGIIKLLWSLAHPELFAVVYTQAAYLLTLSNMSPVLSQTWDIPAVSAALINFSSKSYISLLHKDGSLSLITFNRLEREWVRAIPPALMQSPNNLLMSPDGLFIVPRDLELVLGWLTFIDAAEETEESLFRPNLDASVGKSPIKRKSFLGIKVSSEVNFHSLFSKPNKKVRQELEETKETTQVEEVQANVSQLQSVMSENLQKVSERGVKIATLQEKTEAMQNKAKEWADMMRKYNEEQAKKKWWQL